MNSSRCTNAVAEVTHWHGLLGRDALHALLCESDLLLHSSRHEAGPIHQVAEDQTGLVPRRAAWLGLVGGSLLIITGTAILLGGNHPSDGLRSAQAIATIPEALWELFLGVYCTIWGFRRDAPILSESAR